MLEAHVVELGLGKLDEALGPEPLEARQRYALGGGARADAIVDPLAPAHLVAVFGEPALIAEALRERAGNIEVVLRISDGHDGALHSDNERVAGRAADVVALGRGGGVR